VITLKLTLRDQPAQVYRFTSLGEVSIGRAVGNELQIRDGRVSGRHGKIVGTADGWRYCDLKSTNGSLVVHGEGRIIVDGEQTVDAPLHDGDLLLLGDVEDPVVLTVAITAASTADSAIVSEGTVVARRAIEDGAAVSLRFFGLGDSGGRPGALLSLLHTLGGETDSTVAFDHVGGFLMDQLPAAKSVALVTSDAALIMTRERRAPVEVDTDPPPYPRGLVAEARERGEAILSTEAPELDTEASLARFGAAAAMVVPLGAGGQKSLGALVVNGGSGGFSPADLDLALALGYQVRSCFDTARLVRRLRAVERRLRDENRYLKAQVEQDADFSDIIGDSPAIRDVFDKMRLVLDADVTVLITGETGTGKELVARALHKQSARRSSRLFAAVNCAALSENLLESELFGHVKGAFTGAHENKKGLFQVADGGTLFLDEIGELSMKLQAKLLRVLQEGEVTPVGSTRPLKVDVRIVTATHRDLREMASESRFREDLFYRINVFPIHLPPLRDRGDDVPALAEFFLGRYAKQFRKNVTTLTEAAAERLKAHSFPGNIRELENEMQRAVLLTPDGQSVDVHVLGDDLRGHTSAAAKTTGRTITRTGTLKETMERLEREVLRQALEEQGWNRSATARELEISRQALMVKLSKYNLVPD